MITRHGMVYHMFLHTTMSNHHLSPTNPQYFRPK